MNLIIEIPPQGNTRTGYYCKEKQSLPVTFKKEEATTFTTLEVMEAYQVMLDLHMIYGVDVNLKFND